MKALVYTTVGKKALEDRPKPEIDAPTDAIVKITKTTICGTDLHIFTGDQPYLDYPRVMGHEMSGIVAEAPANSPLAQGDPVFVMPYLSCGRCVACRQGKTNCCVNIEVLGVHRDGAFAEFVAIPDSVVWQNDRAKLPPEIATLQEPFGNAVFALSHADLAGKTVAVLGCGPVGLFSVGIASVSGAGRVIASDTRPFRLDLARKMGADATIDASIETLAMAPARAAPIG